MDLIIVNQNAESLHAGFGIPDSRANEIAAKLDEVFKQEIYESHKLLKGLQDVAYVCETPEELVYAVMMHTSWLEHRGLNIYCEHQQPTHDGIQDTGTI
jgi:hypothetical protein